MNLLDVKTFLVPRQIADASVTTMQAAGRQGAEAFLAWPGKFEDDGQTFRFSRAVFPAQTAYRTTSGLLVKIDGQALFELNRGCHQQGEIVGGQIHSHPTGAYHSEADDALALVRLQGGLSIVVPDFARAGLTGADRWSVHQLDAEGRWGRPTEGVRMEWA